MKINTMLTIDTFNEVCMLSRSKKSKYLRHYFIVMETMYKEFISIKKSFLIILSLRQVFPHERMIVD